MFSSYHGNLNLHDDVTSRVTCDHLVRAPCTRQGSFVLVISDPETHHSPSFNPSSCIHGVPTTAVTMMQIASAVSPVPSEIFALLALLVISIPVLLILRYFLPLRTTPAFYLVPIFFALWLPAGIVLLVPIDLASSASTEDEASKGIWLPQRLLLVSWRITYWLTFCLTW
jgi:hypothetical protein